MPCSARMRTHKPLGRWPRLSRRQGWWICAGMILLSLLWLAMGSLWFVEWQAAERLAVAQQVREVCEGLTYPARPDCASEWAQAQARIEADRPAFWNEAIETSLLAGIIFWVLVAGIIAIAHWIVTGEFPSA